MSDPLVDVITLLQPRAVFSKVISGAGRWGISYPRSGVASFCAVIGGRCRLQLDRRRPLTLDAGDFLLLPTTPAFTLSSLTPPSRGRIVSGATTPSNVDVRHGTRHGPPDVELLGGYFVFGSPDAGWLVSLLPAVVHIRGVERLSVLVRLVGDEARGSRAGRELVLTRLVEILLVESLRTMATPHAPPGLLRAIADPAIAPAIRQLHQHPARPWTMRDLARVAALSRSAFFERFTRVVGCPPGEYLQAWRMTLAKELLRRGTLGVAEVAERVGYGAQSTFSAAFGRHVGVPPRRYASSVTPNESA